MESILLNDRKMDKELMTLRMLVKFEGLVNPKEMWSKKIVEDMLAAIIKKQLGTVGLAKQQLMVESVEQFDRKAILLLN